MRSLVGLGLFTIGACVAPSVQLVEPVDQADVGEASAPVEIRTDEPCVPLDGNPATCCPSRLGLDPEFVRDRCGWSEYVGERSEISCVHGFRDRLGEPVELRVTPIVGLTLARALELHATSFDDLDPLDLERWSLAADGEIVTTTQAGRVWAFIPGWPAPRRVTWLTRDCPDERMLEVLGRMSEAPIDPAGTIALPQFEIDTSVAPLAMTGLLVGRPLATADLSGLRLPDDAPEFANAVLDRVAANDLAGFVDLLAPDARWGLPDRRQLGGRPIAPRPSFIALGQAAARMANAGVQCPEPDRRLRAALCRGELSQWCFWVSDDGLDILALSLRSIAGQPRLEYLGVFPQRPTAWTEVVGEPPAPPMTPRVPVTCGDPHHDDPVRCPEPIEIPADVLEQSQPNQRPASTIR